MESQRLFSLQLTHAVYAVEVVSSPLLQPPICHCDTALARRLHRLSLLYLMNDSADLKGNSTALKQVAATAAAAAGFYERKINVLYFKVAVLAQRKPV